MFSRKCPACSQSISFQAISQYLKAGSITCPYCLQKLKIKTLDSLVNSFWVGALAGFLAAMFEVPVLWAAVIGAVTAIVFQKYVDVFFSLAIDETPEF